MTEPMLRPNDTIIHIDGRWQFIGRDVIRRNGDWLLLFRFVTPAGAEQWMTWHELRACFGALREDDGSKTTI